MPFKRPYQFTPWDTIPPEDARSMNLNCANETDVREEIATLRRPLSVISVER